METIDKIFMTFLVISIMGLIIGFGYAIYDTIEQIDKNEDFCKDNGMEHSGNSCKGLQNGKIILKEFSIYQGERYFLE